MGKGRGINKVCGGESWGKGCGFDVRGGDLNNQIHCGGGERRMRLWNVGKVWGKGRSRCEQSTGVKLFQ